MPMFSERFKDTVRLLLALGADRNVQDLDGTTPLAALEHARKSQAQFMATFGLAGHVRANEGDAIANEIREMLNQGM
jgi:ankyrin repeat protein